jgi:branched-chain amino acid transport system ATP-binding protein
MTAALIAARDVHTYYGSSHILRGVTLEVKPGESVGLMGRNGMGKTTLLRTMMGLEPARRGTIEIDGENVTGAPAFRISQHGIAFVPEGRGIFASLRVSENLAIAERAGVDGRQAWTRDRVLGLFPRLGERLGNRGDQLSGGEQQMLAIARALLTNPRVVIFDEATEGLAPIVRDEIWRTIKEVRASGIATLVVDKTISEVAKAVDRVAVLVKGEIVFEGTPAALISDQDLMHRHLGV